MSNAHLHHLYQLHLHHLHHLSHLRRLRVFPRLRSVSCNSLNRIMQALKMTQLLEATSYTGAILRTFTPTQLHLLVRAFDVVAEQRLYVACPAPSSASCSSLHPRLEMAPCGTLLRRGLAVLKTQYLKKKAVLRAERTKLSNMRQIIRQRVSAKDEREADRWSSLSSGSSLLGDSTDECVENNESGKDSAAKPKGPTQPLPTVFKSGPVKPKGPGPPPVEDAKAHSAKPKGLAPPPRPPGPQLFRTRVRQTTRPTRTRTECCPRAFLHVSSFVAVLLVCPKATGNRCANGLGLVHETGFFGVEKTQTCEP